ncbi:hypothetical protein LTR84_002358 [Exophiala bonariae]|uniref:Dienelactone hydrolase domain-containing protein n=1 Tax=Exophiala bonariae TaxID=1690606 RepID=A0AAV9N9I6_9EURO|nr:hypothetical protein LTR84_002358 [Exophiala bonariae]
MLHVTGPPESADVTTGILSIYDAFGFFPQTQQGADIVSAGLTSAGGATVVFMPDFFNGNAIPLAWYPSDTPEKLAAVMDWFHNVALPDNHVPRVAGILVAAERLYPNIKTWGLLGYCWGGKMTSMLSAIQSRPGAQQVFTTAVQLHPGLIDAKEAAEIKIPTCLLASKDEVAEEIWGYDAKLLTGEEDKGKKHVEIFEDQVHGWLSARADLADERVRAEYERGYQIVVKFFAEHLWPKK